MDYIPPVGGAADAPYIDGNPNTCTEGSIPPAAAIEYPMREIVNAIKATRPQGHKATRNYFRRTLGGIYLTQAVTQKTLQALSSSKVGLIAHLICDDMD